MSDNEIWPLFVTQDTDQQMSGLDQPSGSNTSSSRGSTLIPEFGPKNRLIDTLELLAPGEHLGGQYPSTSAEIHVSSNPEMAPLGPNVGYDEILEKTLSDLQTLRDNGFDIRLQDAWKLGEGAFGSVYRGTFTDQITELGGRRGTRVVGVASGHPFAAKYVQFVPNSEHTLRLVHEIEKRILKRLRHENTVSFKMIINLGKRRYFRNTSHSTARPIVSYDRNFLVMECADASLEDFGWDGKINDRLAMKFAHNVCSGMDYMHSMGVIHMDAHDGNVLVFGVPKTRGDFVAKWTDFGKSLCVNHYNDWGVHIGRKEFNKLRQDDIIDLAGVIKFIYKRANDAGFDLGVLSKMADDLIKLDKPLDQFVKDLEFK